MASYHYALTVRALADEARKTSNPYIGDGQNKEQTDEICSVHVG